MPGSRSYGLPALTAVVVVVVALATGGCGGSAHGRPGAATADVSSTSSPASPTTASSSSRAAARHRPPARPHGAPVGATLRTHGGGSTLDVTVTRVLDDLTITGAGPVAGSRPAGVEVTIHNLAGATYDSTASGDWSLLTTAGLASPLFVRHGECETPLTDFESLIGPGETRTGCVAFSVPRRARILSVRFSPHSRAAGTVAWR